MGLQPLLNIFTLTNVDPPIFATYGVNRKTHLPTGRSAMLDGIESAERVI